MKINSEIISTNLVRLEKAQKEFHILIEYQKISEISEKDQYLSNLQRSVKDECYHYGLRVYVEFIDYIVDVKNKNQEIFYKSKIKNKDFQDILVQFANDEDAKKSFKSKTKKSFETLINSKKWDVFTAAVLNRRRRIRRYTDNLKNSSAIIANYVIQNQIEINSENTYRINKFYLHLIPVPDLTIKNEILRTKEIIDFVIQKLSESGSDFKKVNFDHLTNKLSEELKNRMLSIEPGEKIKCIEVSPETYGLTLNKTYDIRAKSLENGILKVRIINDSGNNTMYNYRLFETVSNLRNSALDELLNDI